MIRLKDIREDRDFTQTEIAYILKTTQANYSRWENGIQPIPLKQLIAFSNFFEVSLDYVVGITKTNTYNNPTILNKKIIGKRIKEFRQANHLTQTEIAKKLNTSQSTISAYEAGETIILTVFALEICYKYKISLDWLCGNNQKPIKVYVISKN